MSFTHSRGRATPAVLLAASVAVLAAAGPAAAHVTVNPQTAEQGGYGKYSFRVPSERPVATTKVEVTFPAEHPIAHVSVRPVPGWQVKVEKAKLAKPIDQHGEQITEAVSKLTWSGGQVGAGEFQEFDVSMGPLPKDTDQLVFKALQTYATGEIVRWIQLPQPGQEEPENPAPILELTPAAANKPGGGSGTGSTPVGDTDQASNESADHSGGSDGLARVIGGLGLLTGLAAVAVAVLALRRRST